MALGTFIAGPYTNTYNSVSIGIAREGWRLQFQALKRLIDQTDAYGRAIVDAVYQGMNCTLTLQAVEYAAKVTTPAWPYGALGVLGQVGRLDSDLAVAIVLTAVAGTPAATAPATFTANKAIISENNNSGWLFGPENRETPIAFRLYPSVVSTVTRFWQET